MICLIYFLGSDLQLPESYIYILQLFKTRAYQMASSTAQSVKVNGMRDMSGLFAAINNAVITIIAIISIIIIR